MVYCSELAPGLGFSYFIEIMVMGMKIKMQIKMKRGIGIRMFGRSEKARVIQPDGQVRQVELPMSVGDLLRLQPHHYVREAITRRSRFKASIMPMEAQLESGGMYLLLPLPRLFPSSSSSAPPLPPPCACFLRDNQEQQQEKRRDKCGSSVSMGLLFLTSCIPQSCKVSPEGVGLGLRLALSGSIHGDVMKRSRIWEPSLERILENEILYPQNSDRKEGESVQERKPANERIEQPSSSSSKANSRPSSSSSKANSRPSSSSSKANSRPSSSSSSKANSRPSSSSSNAGNPRPSSSSSSKPSSSSFPRPRLLRRKREHVIIL